MIQTTLKINGMACGMCESHVNDAIRNAFAVEPKDNTVFLPGVMSRKKQVIPMLTTLWG